MLTVITGLLSVLPVHPASIETARNIAVIYVEIDFFILSCIGV